MINAPRHASKYSDREIDCQEAMEPGFQAIVDCMLEAGWNRGEVMRSLRRLVVADNMTQKENARVETELAIAWAMQRTGKTF
ncbi:hypothetical protein FJ987_18540 [Mesorhizobium sp. CU2]|uniref:hypothetical protein n=1 Tax=unclassified Mesorhizobium TaxID=325217 RepID=UPI00112A2478|nr:MULTISPECIES: hypothetical protein [unclassified Mesorhizobium]TPN81014.1 hypothetical protein FJ988_19120 [Mesorhizobium sp. CU3]TPO11505.1 hypothetical protein FJ987_18540 [Mesorhizobium sp. CU2]